MKEPPGIGASSYLAEWWLSSTQNDGTSQNKVFSSYFLLLGLFFLKYCELPSGTQMETYICGHIKAPLKVEWNSGVFPVQSSTPTRWQLGRTFHMMNGERSPHRDTHTGPEDPSVQPPRLTLIRDPKQLLSLYCQRINFWHNFKCKGVSHPRSIPCTPLCGWAPFL